MVARKLNTAFIWMTDFTWFSIDMLALVDLIEKSHPILYTSALLIY